MEEQHSHLPCAGSLPDPYGTSGRSCSMGSFYGRSWFSVLSAYKNERTVTSTYDEWKYHINDSGYPEGYVQELGLCRFDQLHDEGKEPDPDHVSTAYVMSNEISTSDLKLSFENSVKPISLLEKHWDAL